MTATDVDLDALIDALAARAVERARPLTNAAGDEISGRAAAGLVTVKPGDLITSQWGNLTYQQSMLVFASVADRNNQWSAAPDGAICYTVAEAAAWLRRAGQWIPLGSSGQPPVTSGGFQSTVDANGQTWVAKPGVNGGNWRMARDVVHAEYYRGAAWSVPTAIGPLGCDVALSDGYGLFTPGTATFTAPIAGLYSHHFQLSAQATAASQWLQVVLTNAAGNPIAGAFQWSTLSSGGTITSNITMLRIHAAAEQVVCKNYASVVMAGVTGVDKSRYQVNYLGTG